MIGTGLKKIAKEYDLRIQKGVAYGNLRGYAVTFSEGMGYKVLRISTAFAPQQRFELETVLNGRNLTKEFLVEEMKFAEKNLSIRFRDKTGTVKKISAFIDWFFPLLDTYGASRWNTCAECGKEILNGQWKLIDNTAYYFHQECAEAVARQLQTEYDARQAEDHGSYARGVIGALLGAALGAVLWALVLLLGYVASIVGFVIGWMVEKGYDLLHGKKGKGKVAIMILAVVFGVFLGTFLGEVFSLISLIRSGEIAGLGYEHIPFLIQILLNDGEYLTGLVGNIAIGLLFAALGIFSLLKRAGREVSEVKVEDLE